MKFTKPNKDNVELGDFLVAEDSFHVPLIGPITKVNEKEIVAFTTLSAYSRSYENAIVLKKDGSYLVGENVVRSLAMDFNNERLDELKKAGMALGNTPYSEQARKGMDRLVSGLFYK